VPGFPAIPPGEDASLHAARIAEDYWRTGERCIAIALLEAALESCAALDPHLPCWLVLRVATAYRFMGRYDDEVDVLLRGRASLSESDDHFHYDARLTKAEALAERTHRTEYGAVTSLSRERKRTARRKEF
jgi:hypothetical protein